MCCVEAAAVADRTTSIATIPTITIRSSSSSNSMSAMTTTTSNSNNSSAVCAPPSDARGESARSGAQRMALDVRSDSTVNSSSQSDGGSECSEEAGEFGDEYDDDGVASDGARYLLKPMPSLLQVCPVDDLAVEDEKRRRRHSRQCSGKNKKRACADAESLPTAPTPLNLHQHQPQTASQTTSRSSPDAARGSSSNSGGPLATPLLRRDSMAIRQQYWKQLGFNLTRSDLERTTGRRSVRHKGLKVRLNDASTKKGESKNFFQFIASWYGSNTAASETKAADTSSSRTEASVQSASGRPSSATTPSQSQSQSTPARKSICFDEEAELFYIPLHTDYSKRQRDCMWHTRVEFVAMVERNLEDVYEEMEREYEEQEQAEYLANEAMALEEARQRKVEAEQRAREASRAAAAAAAAAKQATASSRSRPASLSPLTRGLSSPPQQQAPGSGPVPTLALCPIETQIKLAPRSRSPHAIRFQYLKHLGIKNAS